MNSAARFAFGFCVCMGFISTAQAQLVFEPNSVAISADTSASADQNDTPFNSDDSSTEDERLTPGRLDVTRSSTAAVGGASASGDLALISGVEPTKIEFKAEFGSTASRSGDNDGSSGSAAGLTAGFSVTQDTTVSFAASAEYTRSPNAGLFDEPVLISIIIQGFDPMNPQNFLNEQIQLNSFNNPGLVEDEFFGAVTLKPGAIYSVSITGGVGVDVFDGGSTSGNVTAKVNFELLVDDTDGDGLVDSWERDGIDTDADGDIELDLPAMGADPMRKDIFVEVDVQSGSSVPMSEINAVRNAFAIAPVSNPDGSTGITLHVMIDDTNLPTTAYPAAVSGITPLIAQTRDQFFGTMADRNSMEADERIRAREEVFRYCIWGGTQSDGASGWGEIPGDDFIVTIDNFDLDPGDAGRTFMHELGHTLGLRHGGNDNVNNKPNYVSVMNYNYQLVVPERGPEFNDALFYDYSHSALPSLNESSLNESTGVGASGAFYSDKFIAFSTTSGDILIDEAVGSTNFDDDMTPNENGVSVDLNNYGSASPGETLSGHSDWANLTFPLRDGANFGSGNVGVGETTSQSGEFTLGLLQQYRSLNYVNVTGNICLADVNQDGDVNGLDFGAWLNAFNSQDPRADQNQDGDVNGLDFGAWLNNFNQGCG